MKNAFVKFYNEKMHTCIITIQNALVYLFNFSVTH